MTDSWYFLNCLGCRSRLRIRSEYTHMRGRCPACGMRIEPPIPRPLKLDDPGGLIPEDEQWPESAMLIEEEESGTEATYGVSAPQTPTTRSQPEPEEELGGVYTIAFDPDATKGAGISRSAEWEQGQATIPDRPAPAAKPAVVVTASPPVKNESPAPIFSEMADARPALPVPVIPASPVAEYETVVDPLFGDVVKVARPVADQKSPEGAATPTVPVARLATRVDESTAQPRLKPARPIADAAPPASEKPRKKSKRLAREESDASSSIADQSEANSAEDARHIYRLSVAEENRIKLDPPPKSVFFEGVFEFPFAPGNRLVFFWLSVGFTLEFLVCRGMYMVSEMGGQMAIIGAAGFGMALLWISIWTFSYGCAGLLSTVTYTASGSQSIHWSDEGWRDRFPALLKVGYYWIIAMAIGSLANLLGLGIYGWLVVSLFLFPAFLLGGMASVTFWNFLNEDILKTILARFPQYLAFYALSLLVIVPASALAVVAVGYTMIVVFVAGPVYAAAWLIYSRLLGRMAYVLQSDGVKKPRRRKKKRKEETEPQQPDLPPQPAPQVVDEPIRMVESPL